MPLVYAYEKIGFVFNIDFDVLLPTLRLYGNKRVRLDTIAGIKIYTYLTSVEPIDIYLGVRITCNDNLYLTNI